MREKMRIRKPVVFNPKGNCPLCKIPFDTCKHEEDYVRNVVKEANAEQLAEDIRRDIAKFNPIPKIGGKYRYD